MKERCEYCTKRNLCDDWHSRVPQNVMCNKFKLDFDTLPEFTQKQIQKMFVGVLEQA